MAVFETFEDETQEEEDFDDAMAAVEDRISAGTYFQALIKADLFDGDDSEIAVQVQQRVRTLLRRELEILLGMRNKVEAAPAPAAPVGPVEDHRFTDEDVSIVKALIEKVKRGGSPVGPTVATTRVVEPRVAPVVSVGAPKQVAVVEPPTPPVARKRPGPKPGRAAAARAAAAAPVDTAENANRLRLSGGRLKRTIAVVDGTGQVTEEKEIDVTPGAINNDRTPMPLGEHMSQISLTQAHHTVSANSSHSLNAAVASGASSTPSMS